MSLVSTLSAVGSKLSSVTELEYVGDEHETDLPGFPAATYEPSSNDNLFLTNAENQRRYVVDIILYQEMTKIGSRGAAKDVLAAAMDAVTTAFDEDFNLGGAVDWCFPIPAEFGNFKGGHGMVMYAKMSIVCVTSALVVS